MHSGKIKRRTLCCASAAFFLRKFCHPGAETFPLPPRFTVIEELLSVLLSDCCRSCLCTDIPECSNVHFFKTVPGNRLPPRSPVSPRGLLDAAFVRRRIYCERFAATGRHFQNAPSQKSFSSVSTFLRASRKVNFAMEEMQKCLEGERQKSSTNCFLLDWNPELILSEGVKSQRCHPTQGKANLYTNAAVR